jgi:L-fuculose-phosphate aldolase
VAVLAHATQRRAIVEVCQRLYASGLIAGQDGNVSVRLPSGDVLVTPAGYSKVDVAANALVIISADGDLRRARGGRIARRARPPLRASSEVAMHLAAYAERDDVHAVVHAHPPTATAFAVAGIRLDGDALAELVYNVGAVPLVPYEEPGSAALAMSVAHALRGADVVLLANHGAVAVGPTLRIAHQRMESLEHAARILLAARQLGGARRLSPAQVTRLQEARARDARALQTRTK